MKTVDFHFADISANALSSAPTPSWTTLVCAPCHTQRAEQLLSCVSEDGAFLLRYSTSDRNVFVLSLRVDSKLWHYRLKREGRTFMVNQHQFEDLCQLVDYYSQNQFVRGICLKYPVNEETVQQKLFFIVESQGCPLCNKNKCTAIERWNERFRIFSWILHGVEGLE